MSGAGTPPPVIRRTAWGRSGLLPVIIGLLLLVAAWGLYRLIAGSGEVPEAATTMNEAPAPLQTALPPAEPPIQAQPASASAHFDVNPPDALPDAPPAPPKDNVKISIMHFSQGRKAQRRENVR